VPDFINLEVKDFVYHFTLPDDEKYYANVYTGYRFLNLPVINCTTSFIFTEPVYHILISLCSNGYHFSNFSLG